MKPSPKALRQVGEETSNSIDRVWQLGGRDVGVALQDNLGSQLCEDNKGLFLTSTHLQQLLSNDSRLLWHRHELDAGDVERVRAAVGEL